MPLIAKVVADLSLDREFDYLVPDALSGLAVPGTPVRIPFGRSQRTGYVVGLAQSSERTDLKSIFSVSDSKPAVAGKTLELARWISEYYGTPLAQALRTVLPGAVRAEGAGFRERLFVSLAAEIEPAGRATLSRREHGEDDAGAVRLGRRRPLTPVLSPEGSGSLIASPLGGEAGPAARGRVRGVTTGQKAETKLSPKQQAVADLLQMKGGMFLGDLTAELGITAAPVRTLEKKGLLRLEHAAVRRDPLANRTILRTSALALMPAQAAALSQIRDCVDAQDAAPNSPRGGAPRVVLLYGVTGSGKTEVYLQAIDHVLACGKGAIVLVPEISLTPQTLERFVGRFGNRVAVLHSHLSDGERHDEWHRIRDGRADIVVGARSAVFAPLRSVGLIVVDEEHEPSYKQEEAPRYSARDVAVMRGRIEKCAVVLGSATPSLESWFNARTGKYRLATLPERADNRKLPVVRIVDMRMERERVGHVNVLSSVLVDAIRLRLERGEQTILFLNRRGFATSLICPRCGYVANCDQCSVSYTYHRSDGRLRCHICGANRATPERCPGCQDPAFRFAGIGTQRVESVVTRCFPGARLQRMDADMTSRKDSYDRILGDFRVGKTDILIGTQMIAKGLHFPNVTLVGVVYADLSLHMPDFRAGERTFQLLTQVAGRAGRGEVSGEVIVQTYTPFHAAVQAARRLDFEGFCEQETESRRELSYPPFTHLMCITLKGPSEEKVSFCATALTRGLRQAVSATVILADPSPAPLARAKGMYRYQIMLRCKSPSAMMRPARQILAGLSLPKRVTVSVDLDATSLL